MSKPDHIDPQRCNVRDFLPLDKGNHELYKDSVIMEYWWGLLELIASFDTTNFVSATEESLSIRQKKELQYLQLLHYTVFVKLAGAYYQIEQMNRFLDPVIIHDYSAEHRAFMTKESFDALNTDLYQSVTALSNELFIMLNRSYYRPTKADSKNPISMSPSDLSFWMRTNRHPYYKMIRSLLLNCERYLDIRHHATHYGFVPATKQLTTGDLLIQRDFVMGGVLTKYDLIEYKENGGSMTSVIDASRKRTDGLLPVINRIYEHLYSSGVCDDYMNDRGIKIRHDYTPYWEADNNPDQSIV